MKYLLFAFVFVSTFACKKPLGKDKLLSFYNDSTLFNIDTVYQSVLIGSQLFSVKFLRERFDENLNFPSNNIDSEFPTLTLL